MKLKSSFYRLASIFSPVRKNKIVFINYGGKGFGDNPKYIAEELKKRGFTGKMLWLLRDMSTPMPPYIQKIEKSTQRERYELSTAKFIIENSRETVFPPKRRGQVFVQTWHGSVAIKKIEGDAEDKLSGSYLKGAKADGERCNAVIVDNQRIQQIYQRAFWLPSNCEYLKVGSPRLDILINEKNNAEIREAVCKACSVQTDAYLVLYAPTFRNNLNINAYLSNLEAIRSAFEKAHKNVILLVRMHPNITCHSENVYRYIPGEIIDVSRYPDAQELIIASDCLISDYSSIAYDFALIRKPVFLCMKDVESYIAERGVYELFYEQPFPQSRSETELIDQIERFNPDEYQKCLDAFDKKYPHYNEGNASQRVVDWMITKGLTGFA